MKPPFLVLLALLFFGTSCDEKMHTTIVSGKVINAGSKQPIDSVLVTLLDGVSTAGEFIPGNTTSGLKNVAYTDKEGNFRVEITGEYNAYLALSKARYEAPNGGLITSVSEGLHENMVYEMKAYSYFNPLIVPINPVSYSKFCPAYFSAYLSDYNCESGWEASLGNSPEHPYSIGFLTFGDMFQIYKIEFSRNNVDYTIIDSVFIKSFETFSDTIYY